MTRFAGTALSGYMDGPDFTGLGRTMMEGASLGRRAVNVAEGDVALAGINSQAKIKSAGYEAEAIKAGGQARGQAAIASGIGSLASGIAGGFGARGSGSGGGTYSSPSPYMNSTNINWHGTGAFNQNPLGGLSFSS